MYVAAYMRNHGAGDARDSTGFIVFPVMIFYSGVGGTYGCLSMCVQGCRVTAIGRSTA